MMLGRSKMLALFLVALLALPLAASGTKMWKEASKEDFAQGKLDGLYFEGRGLRLAPKTQALLEDPTDFVWDVAAGAAGEIYAATGNEGKLFRISPSTPLRTGGGKVEVFYEVGDVEVLSVTLDEKGVVYAGTGPGGKIWKISPDGKTELLFEKAGSYVWDMELASDGRLVAALGGKEGEVISVSPDGSRASLLVLPNNHVLSLALAGDSIYASTATDGVIYCIKGGRSEALYDASVRDIHALAIDGAGYLYAGTADLEEAKGAGENEARVISELLSQPPSGTQAAPPLLVPPEGPQEAVAQAENLLLRLSPTGDVLPIFRQKGLMILSVLAQPEGVYFGTGSDGAFHFLNSNLEEAKVLDTDYAQVLCIERHPDGGFILGTGGKGQVLKVGPEKVPEGTYTSKVFDAETVARFGKIYCEGEFKESQLSIETRSGNVAEPDSTWSTWSECLAETTGSEIRSPAGRFFQYRLHLKLGSAAGEKEEAPLLQTKIYYLPANRQPRLEKITVGEREKKETETQKANPEGASPDSKITVTWQAQDPDTDTLSYDLYFKGATETNWKLVKENLSEAKYEWESSSLPDGKYILKVVASDRESNSRERALEHYMESEPVTFDHTAPVVESFTIVVEEGRKVSAKAKVVDATSVLSEASYSVDARDWKALYPEDGIFDSSIEEFTLSTEALSPGEHVLTFRASDATGNTSAAKQIVVISE